MSDYGFYVGKEYIGKVNGREQIFNSREDYLEYVRENIPNQYSKVEYSDTADKNTLRKEILGFTNTMRLQNDL